MRQYDALASYFLKAPMDIFGVYQSTLQEGIYRGHMRKPTTKSGIIVALKGEADFVYEETSYPMSPGCVMIGGYDRYFEMVVRSAEFEYFLVHFLPSAAGKEQDLLLREVHLLHIDLDAALLQLMKQLRRHSAELGYLEQMEKKLLFDQLVHKALTHERNLQNSESHSMMEQTMEFIRQHYMEPITLESLAEQHGMKPKYFSHLFCKYTGTSPIHYLIQYRMNAAFELLVTSAFSVRDIALSVGYSDAYYFSRLFKKHYKVSPTVVKQTGIRKNPS